MTNGDYCTTFFLKFALLRPLEALVPFKWSFWVLFESLPQNLDPRKFPVDAFRLVPTGILETLFT